MNQNLEFLDPQLSPNNLDRYVIRSSILKALKLSLPSLRGKLLDVGCGRMPYKSLLLSENSNVSQYISLDLEASTHAKHSRPDLLWDGKVIPLEAETVDCAMATEVFEHCPNPEHTMREICRVLKPGGVLFFTVPFLWNLHEVPYDEYRYTPFSMRRHLTQAGFGEVEIEATGGWDAALAQMLGLWVRRRLQGRSAKVRLVRGTLSRLLLPIIWLLAKRDRAPQKFTEGVMITGLRGLAKK